MKRYRLSVGVGYEPRIDEHPEGEWVVFADHEEDRRRAVRELSPFTSRLVASQVARIAELEEKVRKLLQALKTGAEQRVLKAMGRIDAMQLQMTAENDEGDDPWVMPAIAELARRGESTVAVDGQTAPWSRRRDAPAPGAGYCTCTASPDCPAHGRAAQDKP